MTDDQATSLAETRRIDHRELLGLAGLLLVAAALRLPSLATRGTWDGDQGHDMLVLRTLVRDGIVPLLGPPTSIGDVHHGAWYYFLLSPAALLTGGDSPLAVVTVIALAGVAAVGVVWWLARSMGGPVAGVAAGALIATSAAAIDESTFIWNPNLIALSSAVALAGAWRAWTGGRGAWWIVSAIGLAVTMQCHILGVALLPIVGVPFVLDARRRPLGRVALGVAIVLIVAFMPLVIHELTSDFSEIDAAIDYVSGGRGASEAALPVRFGIIGLRVVSWPLVGLITDGFVLAVAVTCAIVGVVAWLWRAGRRPADPVLGRWFGLALLWATAFLSVAAPSLTSVVPGLPNDHYHAFADPIVFVLAGTGVAAAQRFGGWRRPAGAVAAVALIGLIAWNLVHLPPWVHPDGGYPAGQAAADRADAALSGAGVDRDAVVLVQSLPDFKSTEAMAYPLAILGRAYVAETPKGLAPASADPEAADGSGGLILLCDDRFAEAIGAHCGGPAEDAAIAGAAGGGAVGSGAAGAGAAGAGAAGAGAAGEAGARWIPGPLLDRFEAAPGRWVSVYGAAPRS